MTQNRIDSGASDIGANILLDLASIAEVGDDEKIVQAEAISRGGLGSDTEASPCRIGSHMKRIAAISFALALSACSGSYKDLESAFAVDKTSTAPVLPATSVTIFSQTNRGATDYRDIATIRATAGAVELEIGMPFMKPLHIPKSAIAGCSMTCFGGTDQYVDLLIPKTGTDLMIPSSKALLEWCWSNGRPMFSSNATRAWRYNGTPLPPVSSFRDQLASRPLFDEQARQSCMGY